MFLEAVAVGRRLETQVLRKGNRDAFPHKPGGAAADVGCNEVERAKFVVFTPATGIRTRRDQRGQFLRIHGHIVAFRAALTADVAV